MVSKQVSITTALCKTAVFAGAVFATSLILSALLSTGARAQAPMSAIGWLSNSVTSPKKLLPTDATGSVTGSAVNSAANSATGPSAGSAIAPTGGSNAQPEAPIAPITLAPITVSPITVTPLGGPALDAVGLLPVSVTGLPRDLWGSSTSADLIRLLRAAPVDTLPAAQDFTTTLLLAELDPPFDTDRTGRLFLARIDKLLDMGALEPAQALLVRAGPNTPPLFRRWFDITLLMGTADKACALLKTRADIAPTFSARIFCLARNGNWNTAALTLGTGETLGDVSAAENALLARFLDPELFAGDPPLPTPRRPTPLMFRMFEAIGEPIPTASLPRAFSHADLRATSGWKPQIEAAERLVRAGALSQSRLFGLYTERAPAASGGVWDRVAAVQQFDASLTAKDAASMAKTLPAVWSLMRSANLGVAFARMYGQDLGAMPLTGKTATLAFRIALLSPEYEAAATRRAATRAATDHADGALARDGSAPVPAAPVSAAPISTAPISTAPISTAPVSVTPLPTAPVALALVPVTQGFQARPSDAYLIAVARGNAATATPETPLERAITAGFAAPAPPPRFATMLAQNRLGEALLRALPLIKLGAAGDWNDLTDALALLHQSGLGDVARQIALQSLLLGRQG